MTSSVPTLLVQVLLVPPCRCVRAQQCLCSPHLSSSVNVPLKAPNLEVNGKHPFSSQGRRKGKCHSTASFLPLPLTWCGAEVERPVPDTCSASLLSHLLFGSQLLGGLCWNGYKKESHSNVSFLIKFCRTSGWEILWKCLSALRTKTMWFRCEVLCLMVFYSYWFIYFPHLNYRTDTNSFFEKHWWAKWKIIKIILSHLSGIVTLKLGLYSFIIIMD